MNEYNSNGLKDGYWEHVYARSRELASAKGNYINGKRHGYWEASHQNGKLCWVGSFDNGKQIGYWKDYYHNGNMCKKEFYL
jgi:antitoxin component YwqK of YwqJK toxin-antitoxin module